MDEQISTELTLRALRMALDGREPGAGLMHHSDRGSPYAARDYRRWLKARGVVCRMSRKGNGYDNAVTERFFASRKTEDRTSRAVRNERRGADEDLRMDRRVR
jgi:transposase InsO family protein